MATNKKKDVLWRVWLSFFGLALFACAILGKAFYTQSFEGEYWKSQADSATIFRKVLEPERGNIYSEDGRLLATSLPYFEIRLDLRSSDSTSKLFKENIDSISIWCSTVFPEKTSLQFRSEIQRARSSGNRYFLLMKEINFTQLKMLKQGPVFRMGRGKSGLIVIQKNKRVLPFGMLAQRTIGYSRDSLKVGVEGSYDEELNGVEGQILVQKLAGGTLIPVNSDEDIEAQSGFDLITTLDVNFQDVAESALLKALKHHKASWGTCILMEVNTGKIKAMANLSKLPDSSYAETYNYAIGERIEPGSTFKLASMIALLEEKAVGLNDSVDLELGVKKFADRTMYDSERHGLNRVSVKRAFAMSSNVGVSTLVNKYFKGKESKYVEYLSKLRLDSLTGIELTGEQLPIIKRAKQYTGVSLPWISVGYEQQISPLQMLCFYNSIANNGKYVKPYLISEIKEFQKVKVKHESIITNNSLISEQTILAVKIMLKEVCLTGTGSSFSSGAPYGIAGKTGTTVLNINGRYQSDRHMASFIGYFPADNPKYTCAVFVNDPKENGYYGGTVAGPVFREVADKVYSGNLNIHEPINKSKNSISSRIIPEIKFAQKGEVESIANALGSRTNFDQMGNWIRTSISNDDLKVFDADISSSSVFDVRGMGLKDALFLLESQGLSVIVVGKGKVVSQSIPGGLPVVYGQKIVITLNS